MIDRWNDSRLDDFYAEFRRMVITVEKVAVLERTLEGVAEDAEGCRTEVAAMRADLASTARNQIAERKSDRRWLIGTCLSTAALIIAAVGIFVGHI